MLLCGVVGGAAVGLGAEVGCGLVPVVVGFVAVLDPDVAGASLIDPACRPDPCDDDPEAGGTPGTSVEEPFDNGDPLETPAPPLELPALVSRPGVCPPDCPQAPNEAQTRAAATAVAAALASATVPRLDMDATVAKTGRHPGGTRRRARWVRRDCSTVSGRDGFSLDNR